MKTYVIILKDSSEESVVGRCKTIEEAKRYLRSVRYYPAYKRTEEYLDLSEDGMSGTGYDENGHFTYTIKTEAA